MVKYVRIFDTSEISEIQTFIDIKRLQGHKDGESQLKDIMLKHARNFLESKDCAKVKEFIQKQKDLKTEYAELQSKIKESL